MRRTMYAGDGRPAGCTHDLRDRAWFDGEGPANHADWTEWLRRHGIDPRDVILSCGGRSGWIERQVDLYRVAWLSIVGDERGRVREPQERYVQLEGKPLPFPEWRMQGANWACDLAYDPVIDLR